MSALASKQIAHMDRVSRFSFAPFLCSALYFIYIELPVQRGEYVKSVPELDNVLLWISSGLGKCTFQWWQISSSTAFCLHICIQVDRLTKATTLKHNFQFVNKCRSLETPNSGEKFQ